MRPLARALSWGIAAVAAVACVVLGVPLAAGSFGVAQLVSFRAVLAVALAAAAVLVAAVGLLLPRRARRAAVPLVLVLALGAGAQVGVLAWRATGDPPDRREAAGAPLVVLSFNTLGVVPPQTLARLAQQQDADVVVLPETSDATAAATQEILADAGIPMRRYAGPSADPHVDGVALLVRTALGEYPDAVEVPMRHGALRVEGAGTRPTIVAVHPVSPTAAGSMPTWREETRASVDECTDHPGAIVAGDFNATLDHPALRRLGTCVDAAREVGEAATGTWPAAAPGWLATPIDHVLVDARAWRVLDFRVLPAAGGSDHRPVVATLEARR
ncbi:endonuclease/exonuclease/phosphatase family protein [Cellulomonas edaphi]|uniref:Endonuclease/exonuclease/phosphatase family protein n=1 Tax=Cellulomonas edaphi TaxID=3053468 RepID=A0ABT7S771_9CELL|nr:endonuclease/exonuclease/phosphatase family protein [Cellulomons edaphi]MDM7831470.1 endonuclease/exonuclease/phosphatase family protein [Cellulomons edaphi]